MTTFYTPSGNPQTGSQGLSAAIRNEFAAIAQGFAQLPPITASGAYTVSFILVGNYAYTLPAASGTLATLADVGSETTRAQAAEALLASSAALTTETNRAQAAEALLAPKASPALANATITGLHETAVALAALNIDCNAGNFFTKTIAANSTFTVSSVPASGTAASFILELTNGGSRTITWWSGLTWPSGVAPTLTTAGTDVLGFYTTNGGGTWRGLLLALNVHA